GVQHQAFASSVLFASFRSARLFARFIASLKARNSFNAFTRSSAKNQLTPIAQHKGMPHKNISFDRREKDRFMQASTLALHRFCFVVSLNHKASQRPYRPN